MLRLVVERGSEKGLSFSFSSPEMTATVGRLQECEIALSDSLVSRQHFAISRNVDEYLINDLGSENGTFLNGKKLSSSTPLYPGAVIRAGETLLAFRREEDMDQGALAGKRIAGYNLLHRIGMGGMGEVYKAIQTSLGRTVALKILSADLTLDRNFVERFMREARAAGKFNHPNVIHVHECGEENGNYFFSMEYVDGGSVQELVAGGKVLEPKRALEITLQAARALEYAQKVGIVHCDIKPDNLMLTSTGDVRLADLGIAKSLNEHGKAEQTEGVFGSPHYMAPEQARGHQIDHRSDLYSLGVTLYRMLLGKLPFTGKDAKQIMERQVFDPPEAPEKLNPNFAPMVYTIVNKLLKKKPADRYQSAAALIRDIELALGQIARGVKPRHTPSRRHRPVKSRPSFWGLLP